MFGVGHQHRELVEEGFVDCLAAGFDWQGMGWASECSRKNGRG